MHTCVCTYMTPPVRLSVVGDETRMKMTFFVYSAKLEGAELNTNADIQTTRVPLVRWPRRETGEDTL
jgi:hypothetical protein